MVKMEARYGNADVELYFGVEELSYNRRAMSKARSLFYRLARVLGDVEAGGSGSPKKMVRRGKNKLLGQLLGRFWRILWR